jgi:hypothetical protein
MPARQVRAVFYIGKEKGDCACGVGGHNRLPLSLTIITQMIRFENTKQRASFIFKLGNLSARAYHRP